MNKISDENKTYPLVLVSDELSYAMTKEIPTPPEPKAVFEPYLSRPDLGGCLFIVIPFLLIMFFIFDINYVWKVVIAGLILLVVVLEWIRQRRENTKEYTRRLISFENDNKTYLASKLAYDQMVRSIRTPEKTSLFRQSLIQEYLQYAVTPNQVINNKRGISESFFENYLNNWFPNRIFKDYGFKVDPKYRSYLPDFIYQDDTNLHLDIEIDEPYTFESNLPAHYINELDINNDINRDWYFTFIKGWVVIRFAEEQVIRYPNECCKVIAKVIFKLTENNEYLSKMSEIGDLRNINRWTYNESMELSKNRYRATYLVLATNHNYIHNNWNTTLRIQPSLQKPLVSNILSERIAEYEVKQTTYESYDDLPF